MSFITIKFHQILLSDFREVALTKFLSSKGEYFPEKKTESKFPGNMHIYTYTPQNYKVFEILLSGFRRVALTNYLILAKIS